MPCRSRACRRAQKAELPPWGLLRQARTGATSQEWGAPLTFTAVPGSTLPLLEGGTGPGSAVEAFPFAAAAGTTVTVPITRSESVGRGGALTPEGAGSTTRPGDRMVLAATPLQTSANIAGVAAPIQAAHCFHTPSISSQASRSLLAASCWYWQNCNYITKKIVGKTVQGAGVTIKIQESGNK